MIQPAATTVLPAGSPWLERAMLYTSRHGHLLLVALAAGVIAMMVFPVATWVLDLLIAFNLALSVMLLMLSMYVASPLGMSTFPSLIVLGTVLRLSLNIASTKQILLHAHAGDIIDTFGRLVMGGQVVVGLVVFAIIAVVQFIVISKGAERVAEVGARFTLDALPGKQMTIEADLRGEFIDKFEARRLRALLDQESHLHGSMDGAMKFVKGDAIAAILIALVNIIAGIAIGVGLKGMGFDEAAARYTLLSIGDGMVSQIPSLLTSISAGIVTTRIAGQAGGANRLADQIARQIMAQPWALLASSGVLVAFALVPGFPKIPFLLLATAMGLAGWRVLQRCRVRPSFQGPADTASRNAQQDLNEGALTPSAESSSIVVPLVLRIAESSRERLSPDALQQALGREKDALQHDLGWPFPGMQVRFDAQLDAGCYVIEVQELPVHQGSLPVQGSGNGSASPAQAVSQEEFLARQLASQVRMRPDAFVGTQEITSLQKGVKVQIADLAEEVNRALPSQRVADVLRRLALEGVSLRYLREIYESLLIWAPREKDNAMLCEYVRIDLGRFICHRLASGEHQLNVLMLDPAAEAAVRAGIQQGPAGTVLNLSPENQKGLLSAAQAAVAALAPDQPCILLTTLEVRRFMRRLLASSLPQLHILSYPELSSDLQVRPVGRISMPLTTSPRTALE